MRHDSGPRIGYKNPAMTASHAILLGLIPPAYLLGSIPFGLIVAKTHGVDPRKAGSGNTGATNVGRLLGGRFFAIVFALDLLKGLVPMVSAGAALRWADATPRAYGPLDYTLWLLVGFAAILGHMCSPFLKFKGGKGVATSAGVVLGLFPYYTAAGLVALIVWAVLFRLTRYVSVASISASGAFVVAYLTIALVAGWPVFGAQWPLMLFACLVVAMIVFKHRSNLARLRAGTENRFGAPNRADNGPATKSH